MEGKQVCNKCKVELPLASFQVLSTGKGHYKRCIACTSAAPAKEVKEVKEVKETPKKKVPKKILTLRSDLGAKVKELTDAYENAAPNRRDILSQIEMTCTRLDDLLAKTN